MAGSGHAGAAEVEDEALANPVFPLIVITLGLAAVVTASDSLRTRAKLGHTWMTS
jgi:hypothetical protein